MERALAEVRAQGQFPVACEAWQPVGGHCYICRQPRFFRKDFLGFADLVALPSLTAIQVTTPTNHSTRLRKIIYDRTETAWWWLEAGGFIEVWTWSQAESGRWERRVTGVDKLDLVATGWHPPDRQRRLEM